MADAPVPFAIGAIPQFCTVADRVQQHLIFDHELEALTEMKRDHIVEIFWGALGAFLGSLVPALDAISRFNDKINPMNAWGLAEAFICVAAFAVVLLTGYLWRQRGKGKDSLVTEIRSRQSMPLKAA